MNIAGKPTSLHPLGPSSAIFMSQAMYILLSTLTVIPKPFVVVYIGIYRKLYISVFDVPGLPKPYNPDPDNHVGVSGTNAKDVITFLKNNCNWPPTEPPDAASSSEDEVRNTHVRMLQKCGKDLNADQNPAGGGGDETSSVGFETEEKARQTLREEMRQVVGQRICTVGGLGDGKWACGEGMVCKVLEWAGIAAEVLFGLVEVAKGRGICELG